MRKRTRIFWQKKKSTTVFRSSAAGAHFTVSTHSPPKRHSLQRADGLADLPWEIPCSENTKKIFAQQIQRYINPKKKCPHVVRFLVFHGHRMFVLSSGQSFFCWRPRCLSMFACWVECKNSSSKKVARHLNRCCSKVK